MWLVVASAAVGQPAVPAASSPAQNEEILLCCDASLDIKGVEPDPGTLVITDKRVLWGKTSPFVPRVDEPLHRIANHRVSPAESARPRLQV